MSIAVVIPTNLVKVLLFKAISIYWLVAVRWQNFSSFARLALCLGFVCLANVLKCAVGC
jgi:hypothetical protein